MADFEVVAQRPGKRPGITTVEVEFRPLRGRALHRPGDFDSNIFHMQLPPTGSRMLIDRLGRAVTESGRLVAPSISAEDPVLDFPAEDSLDPYRREAFTRPVDAEMTANINAYWERKLKADDEGDPYPQHHRTTLPLQVGESGHDGYTFYTPPSNNLGTPAALNTTSTIVVAGSLSVAAGYSYNSAFLFTGVSGLSGATINSAIFSLTGSQADVGTPETLISAEDVASPTAYTTKEQHDGATRTSNKVTWDNPDLVTSGFTDAPSISTVIQELANDYDPSTIMILWDDDLKTDSDHNARSTTYDADTSKAAKLDLDFGPGGAPAITSQRLKRGQGR